VANNNDRAAPLILGIGNGLMRDDGAGPACVALLEEQGLPGVDLVDGGTCGLALLPAIEDCAALIVIDAARLGAAPGTVSVHEGAELDRLLRGNKETAHEVALCDLLDAAACTSGRPEPRALIAVEPEFVRVGQDLSPAVAAAIPRAAAAARALLDRWSLEAAA
jgi:hydrogenase maturation protease